jgi:hypothetical protein
MAGFPHGAGTDPRTSRVDDDLVARPRELDDSSDPPSGVGFYYLVRGRSACGVGSYGRASGGTERVSTACP